MSCQCAISIVTFYSTTCLFMCVCAVDNNCHPWCSSGLVLPKSLHVLEAMVMCCQAACDIFPIHAHAATGGVWVPGWVKRKQKRKMLGTGLLRCTLKWLATCFRSGSVFGYLSTKSLHKSPCVVLWACSRHTLLCLQPFSLTYCLSMPRCNLHTSSRCG